MYERTHDYPTALAADPRQPDVALSTAINWITVRSRDVGGEILIYVPGKQNVAYSQTLSAFSKQPGLTVETWRRGGISGWRGGPVLAAWPSREKLADIADRRGVRALCVVPWADGEVDAWAEAARPELLLGPQRPPLASDLDPVVVAALESLTLIVNHGNNLAGSLDKRDAVVTVMTLLHGGHALDPQAIYAWALAHGWPGAGAERLREMADKARSGIQLRTGTREPAVRTRHARALARARPRLVTMAASPRSRWTSSVRRPAFRSVTECGPAF